MSTQATFRAHCPHCGKAFSVRAELEGKTIACPNPACGKPVGVSAAAAADTYLLQDAPTKVADPDAQPTDIADQLQKLHRLRQSGALSDEEFAAAKKTLLNGPEKARKSYKLPGEKPSKPMPADALPHLGRDQLQKWVQPLTGYWAALQRAGNPKRFGDFIASKEGNTPDLLMFMAVSIALTSVVEFVLPSKSHIEFTRSGEINNLLMMSIWILGGLLAAAIAYKPLRLVGGQGSFRATLIAAVYTTALYYPMFSILEGLYSLIAKRPMPHLNYLTLVPFCLIVAQIHNLGMLRTMVTVLGANAPLAVVLLSLMLAPGKLPRADAAGNSPRAVERQTKSLVSSKEGSRAGEAPDDISPDTVPRRTSPRYGARPKPLDCTGPNGVSADVIRSAQEAWAKYLGRQVEANVKIANGVTMTFVLVPPGKFWMGSPSNELGKNGRYPNETLHVVTLTEPFDLSKYEVTQAQYQALTGKDTSLFKGGERPVESVTWNEADAFGRDLTKERSDEHLYRLATEAEWEYSCRGGRPTSQAFGIGDGRSLTPKDANFNNLVGQTSKVGLYAANALGLYDMHGNVWEWCADWNEAYPNEAVTNPFRATGGPYRVARGGCHNEPAPECRSALRQGSPEARRDCWMGFRLARGFPVGSQIETQGEQPMPTESENEAPSQNSSPGLNKSQASVSINQVIRPTVPARSFAPCEEGSRAGDERDDNALKMRLCWCPAGAFRMGSPKEEAGRFRDECSPVDVTLSHGFWMGKTEVTQSQWQKLMGTSLKDQKDKVLASSFAPMRTDKGTIDLVYRNAGDGPDYPMYNVSEAEAAEFCRKLTASERRAGRLGAGCEYRLPTDAQWEYACRAGTTTATAFGDHLGKDQANFDWMVPYRDGPRDPNHKWAWTVPVGSYRPNAWGLLDMHGNVWEWCRDEYAPTLAGGRDPQGPPQTKNNNPGQVMRGGSWSCSRSDCRSASRGNNARGARTDGTGFRVALVPSDQNQGRSLNQSR